MMKTFPCENCITLPICKNRIVFSTDKQLYNISYISSNCDPFFEWWKNRGKYLDDEKIFRKVYNIPEP